MLGRHCLADEVLLAHRECNWMPSDPRPVKEWFLGEVDAKGEQFRRVVRYLKAFRDWRWASGGPASILLMAAAAPLFEKRDRRDDLALLDVVAALPARLRGGVNNPVEESESLTERLGKAGVEEAAKAFEEFEKVLRGATDAGSPSQACLWMRGEFGPRFPNEPDRVKVVSVAATIAAAPAISRSERTCRANEGWMSSAAAVADVIEAFKQRGFEFVGKTDDGWFKLHGRLTPPHRTKAARAKSNSTPRSSTCLASGCWKSLLRCPQRFLILAQMAGFAISPRARSFWTSTIRSDSRWRACNARPSCSGRS
jgi:hypothetical protein